MTSNAISQVQETYTRPSSDPRVLVVDGYGIKISVHRGHLQIADGIGSHRRERRIPRIERTVQRIVVLSDSGYITLDALAWCADVGVTLVHLDRDANLLTTSTPPAASNARLRRAQAFASTGGPSADTGLSIIKNILAIKIEGQAEIAANQLGQPDTAAAIRGCIALVNTATTVEECRGMEGLAAARYWGAWTKRARMPFHPKDLEHMPAHWYEFSGRASKTTDKARGATDPINALLNYSYRLAEIECRLACIAIGLDPALGFLHADEPRRDSLALDLLEILRPEVDRQVLKIINPHYLADRGALRRMFHETRDGTCRIIGPLTHQLAEQTPCYAKLIAPQVERIANQLSDIARAETRPGTRLTSNRTMMKSANGGPNQPRKPQLTGDITVERIVPDDLWNIIAPLLPAKPTQPSGGRPFGDDRAALAGIICVALLGSSWAQIPKTLGVSRWTCKTRLDRWIANGTWDTIRTVLETEATDDSPMHPGPKRLDTAESSSRTTAMWDRPTRHGVGESRP